jgi:uncharacterized membrane protein
VKRVLSKVFFRQEPERNLVNAVLLVLGGCLFVWLGIMNLTKYTHGFASQTFVLGLAFLSVALQLFLDAVVHALPSHLRRTKLWLRVVVLLIMLVALTLLSISCSGYVSRP